MGCHKFLCKDKMTKSFDPHVLLQDFNRLSVSICHTVTRKSSIPNHGRQGYKRMIRTMVGDGRDMVPKSVIWPPKRHFQPAILVCPSALSGPVPATPVMR